MRRPRPATRCRRCAAIAMPALVDAGEQDLTAHVDFEALGRAARDAGAAVTPVDSAGRMARTAWASALRAAALARPTRSGRPRSKRRRPAVPARSRWAGCSRRWRSTRPAGRCRRGSEMTSPIASRGRDDCAGDRRASSARASATRSRHLYRPEDLAAFLASFTGRRGRASWPTRASPSGSPKRTACRSAIVKLGPPQLPVETERPMRSSSASSIVLNVAGRGHRAGADGLGARRGPRRGAEELYLSVFTDNHRARRFYARYGFEAVGPTTSWSATRRTRTSSCG